MEVVDISKIHFNAVIIMEVGVGLDMLGVGVEAGL